MALKTQGRYKRVRGFDAHALAFIAVSRLRAAMRATVLAGERCNEPTERLAAEDSTSH